ncbi:MAG: redoxin domain-containing protein [Caldilineaceae bacterium]
MEATEFRDRIPQFDAKDVAVYGLSPDDIESHNAFAEKFDLNFPLLADVDKEVIMAMGLWVQREARRQNLYGRCAHHHAGERRGRDREAVGECAV